MTKRKKSDINKPLSGDNHATQKDQRQKWPFWIGTGGRFQSESLAVFVGMRNQGSQFTSWAWIDRLKEAGVGISMDGKGRFMDNIFIERLWRSLKYECIYLHAFEGGAEVRAGIRKWIAFYNQDRPHTAHGGHTPQEYYYGHLSRSGPGLRTSLLATDAIAGIINMKHRPGSMIVA